MRWSNHHYLKQSKLLTAVKKLEVLSELEFDIEHNECEQSLLASVENAEKVAAGEHGDRVKFAAAAKQQENRWRLFLAVLDAWSHEHDDHLHLRPSGGYAPPHAAAARMCERLATRGASIHRVSRVASC